MKAIVLISLLVLSANVFSQHDTLFLVYQDGTDSPAYINSAGDTIIPAGLYQMCFTEIFVEYAIVVPHYDSEFQALAINQAGEVLFQVYWFDNGPDYLEEGRFRIVKNDLVGYANEKGEILIEPKYACADPFQDGIARVTFECTKVPEGEFTRVDSDSWFYIDLDGNPIEE